MKSFLINEKITKKIKKPVFSAYYNLDISLSADSSEEILRLLTAKFTDIYEKLPRSNDLLTNIQGRDNQDLHIAAQPLSQQEKEILLISGNYKEEDGDEINTEFSIRVFSVFNSFSGKTKIYNAVKESRINLPAELALKDLCGDSKKYNITQLRFALEFFSARSLIPFLLLSPSVTEYFYLEANLEKLYLDIYSEDLKTAESQPFTNRNVPGLSDFIL